MPSMLHRSAAEVHNGFAFRLIRAGQLWYAGLEDVRLSRPVLGGGGGTLGTQVAFGTRPSALAVEMKDDAL